MPRPPGITLTPDESEALALWLDAALDTADLDDPTAA